MLPCPKPHWSLHKYDENQNTWQGGLNLPGTQGIYIKEKEMRTQRDEEIHKAKDRLVLCAESTEQCDKMRSL